MVVTITFDLCSHDRDCFDNGDGTGGTVNETIKHVAGDGEGCGDEGDDA